MPPDCAVWAVRYTELMAKTQQTPRKSLFESPWYWIYVFATGALIALMLLGWKFGPRQAQIENKFLGHEAAAERAAGGEPAERELSTSDDTMIGLTPLYIVLGVVFVVAWIAVWRQLFVGRSAQRQEHGADAPRADAAGTERDTNAGGQSDRRDHEAGERDPAANESAADFSSTSR